jgi:hypothetical protein
MPDIVVEAARPESVRLAEWTYLAAMALQLGVSAMIWDETVQVFGAGLAIADLAFTLGMVLLLLLLTTRRGSRGARIALAFLTGVTVAYRLWQFAVTEGAGTAVLLLLVQGLVMLAGAILLFRPDANAWFALPPDEEEEEELA